MSSTVGTISSGVAPASRIVRTVWDTFLSAAVFLGSRISRDGFSPLGIVPYSFRNSSSMSFSFLEKLALSTLLILARRSALSPVLYSSIRTPACSKPSRSFLLLSSGMTAASTSSKPTARRGLASKYPVGISAAAL